MDFITDRVSMIIAFDYMSRYFNKILYVNLLKDSYKIIKTSKDEYNDIHRNEHFSEWTNRFANSFECDPSDKESFLSFIDISRLKGLTKPSSINYRKMVSCVYHDVYLEVIPLKGHKCYIFVKDWSLME